MEKAVNTALLFIQSYLVVNTTVFDRAALDQIDPYAYNSDSDRQLLQKTLAEAPMPSVLFLRDRLMSEYCFVPLKDRVIEIGPYRSKRIYRSDLNELLLTDEASLTRYITKLNGCSQLSRDQLRFALNLLFIGIYESSEMMDRESEIDLAAGGGISHELSSPEASPISTKDTVRDIGHGFYYISQVRSGNVKNAIIAYRRIMNRRITAFNLLRTVEGMSVLRAQTSIALHEAGVPDTAAEKLLAAYKLSGRHISSAEAARKASEKLISDSCLLVRENIRKNYSRVIGLAVDYIRRNSAEQFTVPDIAKEVGLTPNALTTKFHKEVGLTPNAYLAKLRMEQAADMLAYTPLSMQSICSKVGLLDANYFTRCFKKHYNMTPTEYRKAHQGG